MRSEMRLGISVAMNHSDMLRDTFDMLLLSLEELLHPELLNGLLNGAGQKLGREASARYRLTRKKKSESCTPMGYVRAMTAGEIWSAEPIEVTPNLIRFVIHGFPTLNHKGALTPIISGFFGSAAADQFGTVRVVVSPGPKEECPTYMVSVCLGEAMPSRKEGDLYTGPENASSEDRRRAMDHEPLSCLSRRELEILTQIGKGCSDKEIATALHLSLRTIQNATSRICQKLGVRNRAKIIQIAGRHHLA